MREQQNHGATKPHPAQYVTKSCPCTMKDHGKVGRRDIQEAANLRPWTAFGDGQHQDLPVQWREPVQRISNLLPDFTFIAQRSGSGAVS